MLSTNSKDICVFLVAHVLWKIEISHFFIFSINNVKKYLPTARRWIVIFPVTTSWTRSFGCGVSTCRWSWGFFWCRRGGWQRILIAWWRYWGWRRRWNRRRGRRRNGSRRSRWVGWCWWGARWWRALTFIWIEAIALLTYSWNVCSTLAVYVPE